MRETAAASRERPLLVKPSLRTASFCCTLLWAGIWLLFAALRVSSIDVRILPGAGLVLLGALAFASLAPLLAAALALAALVRQGRAPLTWLALACALAAFFVEGGLFLASRWM